MDYVVTQLDSFILSVWSGIIGGWMVALNRGEKSFKKSILTFETFLLGITMFFVYLIWAHPEYRDFGGWMTIMIFLFIFLLIRLFRMLSFE